MKKKISVPCTCKKGRSSELLRLRNVKLIKRYYELSEVQRVRSDDVLFILSTKEFFLSEQRIWRIILKNHELIDALRNGKNIDNDKPLRTSANQLDLF